MEVPTELLTMVFRDLSKAELKLCRLVCKTFNRVAIPLLFDEVFLSTNRADFEIARSTVERFGPNIRTLIFSSAHYRDVHFSEACHEAQGHNYLRLQEEQRADLEAGTILDSLRLVLQGTKLQHVSLRDFGSYFEPSVATKWPTRYPTGGNEVCYIQGRTKTGGHLHLSRFKPTSGFEDGPANSWNLLMSALCAIRSNIKGIDIRAACREVSIGLAFDTFAPIIPQSPTVSTIFSNLSTLDLELSVQTDEDERCFEERRVARYLSLATGLMHLSLTFSIDGSRLPTTATREPSEFQACLGGCRFPRLTSLNLSNFSSSSEYLLEFLGSSPELASLSCDSHRLESGTWEAVADWIQANLRLKTVNLQYLDGGWTGAKAEEDFSYGCREEAVENFFLHAGENPFSEAALEEYKVYSDEEGYGEGDEEGNEESDEEGNEESDEEDDDYDEQSDGSSTSDD